MREIDTAAIDVQDSTKHYSTGRSENERFPDIDEILDGDDERVETPLDVKNLSMNPGHEKAPRNPLCPVCEEQIRPLTNHAERRFVCGCEVVWQFTFDCDIETESDTDRGDGRE